MDSILEQNPDYAFGQLEADPFNFAQEFGSTVDTSVIDPNFSSQGFYFPEDPAASSSYATDNASPIQSFQGLGLDWQTLDVLGMQNDAFTPSQSTSFQDAALTLPASGEVDMRSHYSNTAAPLVDPYYNTFQPFDLDDASISPPMARTLPPNPQAVVPINRSLMRGRKAATNAYQYPQLAPMTYATPHYEAQAPYFDATFAKMGYGMQPGPYCSMSAPAVPTMNVNIQFPSDQMLTTNFPVQRPPVAHPSYNYSNTMAMPASQPNENLDFAGQRFYSEHLMQPSSSYIPAVFDSRGSSCGSEFPPYGGEVGVYDVHASPRELQHSSVIRGRENKMRRDKRLRGTPYPKSSPATSARPTTQPTETESRLGGTPYPETSPATSACPTGQLTETESGLGGTPYPRTSPATPALSTLKTTETESREHPDSVFVCCWGGCGHQLADGDKATCQKHLAIHGIRTFGQTPIKCEWTDPESGEVCGKLLQMQSILKHVCGRTHLGLMSKGCPLCELPQARGSNIHRHWLSCSFFINLDEEKQKQLWSEYSKKPFDWYIEQQETRGVIPPVRRNIRNQ